jgi:hypothetical protein
LWQTTQSAKQDEPKRRWLRLISNPHISISKGANDKTDKTGPAADFNDIFAPEIFRSLLHQVTSKDLDVEAED